MKNKIYSIIVTYNPILTDFKEVLKLHLSTKIDGIIIIDNNSNLKNEIKDLIQFQKKKIPIFVNFLDNNEGIAYAQNIGIKIAKRELCSHIVLFDQDSFVTDDFVDRLIEQESILISKGYKVGAIGPVYRDLVSNNFYPLIRVKGFSIEKVWPDKISELNIKVSFIIASGSLINIATIDIVGLMNEDFFIDCVDIEWCFRASNSGYSIFATKAVSIFHAIGEHRKKSLGREISIHVPIRRYYGTRNNILMSKMNWIPFGYRIRIFFGLLIKIPIHLYDFNFNSEHIKYTFMGILHGLLNKKGSIK